MYNAYQPHTALWLFRIMGYETASVYKEHVVADVCIPDPGIILVQAVSCVQHKG